MKPFENKTNIGNEPAVKKGSFLPSDSVNIGYFSSEKISPEKHLSVIDLSSRIPENTSSIINSEVDTIMYADEFGVLRYVRSNSEAGQVAGSPIVNNSEVSISNNIMNFGEEEINYNFTGRENEFESNFFVHSYYVSNNYVLLSSSVAEYEGIENSSELQNPLRYNIRVVDHSGKVDTSVKYKILLEKYTNNRINQPLNGSLYETLDLYRIIVLLEKADPENLYLIYDKYEKDEENIPYNPFFGYKEKINAVPYYNYVTEESEVIDVNSLNKRVYSTQLFSYKENELLKTRINNDGWKIITPRKAIQDPRTFQNFNWRLIAKINYNFSQTKNIYSNDERPVINVGVLYSGQVSEAKNAYMFNNMQESVFNLQNYIFQNPNADPSFTEAQKQYWLIDIDDVSKVYANYDLLVWSPTRPITEVQAQTIENILQQNVSVLIDMSSLNLASSPNSYSSNLTNFQLDFYVQNQTSGNLTINEVYKNADTELNAWSLAEYEETQVSSLRSNSIFGRRKDIFNNSLPVVLPTFVGQIAPESLSISLVNIGNTSAVIKRSSRSNALFPSSLIVTAIPFLQLVNDIFSTDGTQTVNNGNENIFPVGTIGNQTNSNISQIVIGPNKFFYNIISDINKTKVNNFNLRNNINNSTVLWNVSPWRNSWTINGKNINNQITVLSEEEKLAYNFSFKSNINSSESIFCRQVSPSISSLLMGDFENTINGGDAQNIINQDYSNVEFYLESTNPNVEFINFTNINERISTGQETLIGKESLSYGVFKLTPNAKQQIVSGGSLSLDAFSTVISRELDFEYGHPYIVTNTSQYQERDGNNIRTPNDLIPGSQDAKDYNFYFNTQIAINQITKTINQYRVNWTSPFQSRINGTGDFSGYLIKAEINNPGLPRTNYTSAQEPENKIVIQKTFSPFNKYPYPSRVFSRTDIKSIDYDSTSSSGNNFHYTGDIDEGNRWDEYFFGKDTTVSSNNSNTTTRTIARGPVIPTTTITNAIYSFNLGLNSGYVKLLLEQGIWDDDVYVNSNSVLTFKKYFSIWLDRFLFSIFGPSITPPERRAYLTQVSRDFIANKFIEQNPGLRYATEILAPSSSSGSSSTNRNGYSSDYVRYIQYTLSQMGYNQPVNGNYDKLTGENIRRFQRRKSQSFVDGIVDSETKSVIAIYWLNLFKNNTAEYNARRSAAPSGSRKYISAAVKYSDIANIGQPGKEYRRLSFTGTAGPTEIVDYIICKVPQVSEKQKIHSVTITSGGWSSKVEYVSIYEQEFNVNEFFTETIEGARIPNVNPRITSRPGSQTISANRSKTISFNGSSGELGIKYVMVKIKSKKLSSSIYGPNAEGFSISNISFELSSDTVYVPPVYGTSSSFEGFANGTISGYTDIQAADQKELNLSTIQQAIATSSQVTSVRMTSIGFSVTNSGITKNIKHDIATAEIERYRQKLNESYQFSVNPGPDKTVRITVNPLSETLSLANPSPSITSAQILSGNRFIATDSEAFSISPVLGRNNIFVVKTTNGVIYDSLETSPITPVNNFFIADADNITSRQNSKMTINIRDGMVVLTNSNGQPAGFPDFNSYTPTEPNAIVSFGFIHLLWAGAEAEPYGLSWQFLHIKSNGEKVFLGKKISYREYMEYKADGNVYIGLKVFDADMNSDTENNIVGESSRNGQLQISNRPTRYVCPVYSVKVKNRSKISISSPSNNLGKFDTWYVNLTQGKFIKKITIPSSYNFTNWLKEYKGKELQCYYDTTKVKTPYSSIFGFGYYDIYDENPIIISDNEIKLRYQNLHAVQEQYDKLTNRLEADASYTDASPVVPWIKVYVKNLNGKWIEISRKEIRLFDKHTGSIVFNREIVPLNEKDIRVNYTIKNASAMLHQINGQSLNINPYNGLNIDKPIHIYLLPIRCEEIVYASAANVEGFTNSLPVHFTDDYSIFNINSDKYDPLALHVGTVKVNNFYSFDNVKFEDMRVRGGGILHSVDIVNEYEENKSILSFADVYSGKGFLHPNGGYVIVKIPKEVINNFNSREDVYNIVRNNLTAGVSFDIQDIDGTDWRSIANVE
jgi:hypothetical protein